MTAERTVFDDRAQSEMVGTMLLVATVVVSMTAFGAFALSWYTDAATRGDPNVALDVTLNDTHATVIHGGGPPLERSEVTVVLRNASGEEAFGLADATVGDGDGQFEGGERAVHSHGRSGRVEVLVVHEASNSVVYRETERLGPPTGATTTTTTTTTPPAESDPGFAYEDVNHDGKYSSADGDRRIPDAEIEDGRYDAGANGLVIPDSVGSISASTVDFAGEDVRVNVDLTSDGGPVTVDAGSGTLNATGIAVGTSGRYDRTITFTGGDVAVDGSTFTARGDVTIDGTGAVTATGAAFDTSNQGGMSITVAGSSVDVSDATFDARGDATVYARGGDLTAVGAGFDTTYGSGFVVNLTAGGAVDAAGATARTRGPVVVDARGGSATVAGATLDTTSGSDQIVQVTASGPVDAENARLLGSGPVTVDAAAGDLDAGNVTVDTSSAYDMPVTLRASGAVNVSAATVTADSTITVTAGGGALTATGATLDASTAYGFDVALASRDDVHLVAASLLSDSGALTVDVTGSPADHRTVYVEGATFADADDTLDVSPDAVRTNGTPESGSVQ